MDISQDVKDSFLFIKNHKSVPVLVFSSTLVFIIIVISFLYQAGFLSIIKEHILNPDLKDAAFDKKIEGLFTMQNIVLLIIHIAAIIFISYYLGCATFALVALGIKKQHLSTAAVMGATNRLLLRFLLLYILMLLIVAAPIIAAVLVVAASFLISKVLGILLIILAVLAAIVYIGFMSMKLLFAIPIMMLEDYSAASSIKQSFAATKGRMKDVGIIFLIVFAISMAVGYAGNSVGSGILSLIKNRAFSTATSGVSLIVYYAIQSIVTSFIYAFLFHAYIDLKNDARPAKSLNKRKQKQGHEAKG